MTLADTVKADLTDAMRAGDRDRVGRLRLLLSELQKAEKDGTSDEVAVLRRERKRRLDAAEQFRDAGRSELAESEEAEAALIEGYLPAELSDDDLRKLVEDAVASSGASSTISWWSLTRCSALLGSLNWLTDSPRPSRSGLMSVPAAPLMVSRRTLEATGRVYGPRRGSLTGLMVGVGPG